MALALVVLEGLSVLAIVTATIAGLASAHSFLPVVVHPRTHVTLALTCSILVLFSHSMTMFYFIGTGVRMKELVAEHHVQVDLVTPTRRIKATVFPLLTMAIVLTMITFILGGGVDTGKIPGVVHLVLALGATVLNYLAAVRSIAAIFVNVRLFDRLDQIVMAKLESGAAPQSMPSG
jgi:hypothetical protein